MAVSHRRCSPRFVDAVPLGHCHCQLSESAPLAVDDARSLIGLDRDELAHPPSPDKGLAELIVLKKRQFGDDVGTTRRLVWVGESYRDYAYSR
jgi:hypothetical protein